MLTKITDRRTLRRWTRAAHAVDHLDASALQDLQRQANRLSRRLSTVLHAAEQRLAATRSTPANLSAPTHTDWAWRPMLWSGPVHPVGAADIASGTRISTDAAIFHDCARNEITLRQTRAPQINAPSQFQTTLDVLGFGGSYLSLAVDLPAEAIHGLTQRHIFTLFADLTAERDIDIYARLNLRFGPNVDHVTCKLDPAANAQCVEFDLATTRIDDTRLNRAWIDLIFEAPAFNKITLHSVALNRRPRAEV